MTAAPAHRGRGTPKGTVRASPEDRHINARIRTRRIQLELPIAFVANRLGVSIQQVRNYEIGTHRVSAGRLFQIAVALCTPVAWFYEGLPGLTTSQVALLEEPRRWERETP